MTTTKTNEVHVIIVVFAEGENVIHDLVCGLEVVFRIKFHIRSKFYLVIYINKWAYKRYLFKVRKTELVNTVQLKHETLVWLEFLPCSHNSSRCQQKSRGHEVDT